jgi:hypothetical protein
MSALARSVAHSVARQIVASKLDRSPQGLRHLSSVLESMVADLHLRGFDAAPIAVAREEVEMALMAR